MSDDIISRAYEQSVSGKIAAQRSTTFLKSHSPLLSCSVTLRSSLRSSSIVFRDLRSSLRSCSTDFWLSAPAPSCTTHTQHCSALFILFIMTASPFYPNKLICLVSMCNIINKVLMFVKYILLGTHIVILHDVGIRIRVRIEVRARIRLRLGLL